MASKPSDEALKERFGEELGVPINQAESRRRVKGFLLEAAKVMRDFTPAGREQNAALKHLEEAYLWAHAAMVREE